MTNTICFVLLYAVFLLLSRCSHAAVVCFGERVRYTIKRIIYVHFLAKAIVSPWPFAFMTWYIKAHIYHYIQNGVCTVGVHSNEVTGSFPASPKAVHRLIYFNAIYFNVFHDNICIKSCSCLVSATLSKYYSLFVQFQLKHSATPFCIFVIYFDNTIISIMLEMKER